MESNHCLFVYQRKRKRSESEKGNVQTCGAVTTFPYPDVDAGVVEQPRVPKVLKSSKIVLLKSLDELSKSTTAEGTLSGPKVQQPSSTCAAPVAIARESLKSKEIVPVQPLSLSPDLDKCNKGGKSLCTKPWNQLSERVNRIPDQSSTKKSFLASNCQPDFRLGGNDKLPRGNASRNSNRRSLISDEGCYGDEEMLVEDFQADDEVSRLTRPRKLTNAMRNFLLQKTVDLRQWKEIELGKVHPLALIGRSCKIWWPVDHEWYSGVIHEYNPHSGKHKIDYEDGESEWVTVGKERVRLHLSPDEIKSLEVSFGGPSVVLQPKKLNPDELAVLAAGVEDFDGEFGHGDVIWAKIKGYPMWPALVMDENHAKVCHLEPTSRERTVPVQFFGSCDYARISITKILQFSKGILGLLHTKCKRAVFEQALQEAERYLKEGKLPATMIQLQKGADVNKHRREDALNTEESGEENTVVEKGTQNGKKGLIEDLFSCPLKIGPLLILSLGKIVRDSEQFHNEHHIWTEGYVAIRKFTSMKDPEKLVEYRMEVSRNPSMPFLPLFRVTPQDEKPVESSTASGCWKKIFLKIQKAKDKSVTSVLERKRLSVRSGPSMFGFANPRVTKLIQGLPNARVCSKFAAWIDKPLLEEGAEEPLPAGYRPVEFRWKHLDRCCVCYLDEEYTDNQLLQCDKCRMMVHMNCYGELEPPDGDLWLCNLCRPGSPKHKPFCCLCPITGGAMKKTTDGRWAHLTCAMWTPETCLVDVKTMEPVDGLSAINKERWKLTCTVCKVPYGVCIQCSAQHCRVSYHPLCARAAGLSMEVLEDKSCGLSDGDGALQLLSYCRKHKQPAKQGGPVKSPSQQSVQVPRDCRIYCPPNSTGCARSEPYNATARRGRREPEAVAAALAKRLFVENKPYVVTGCRRRCPNQDVKSSLECSLGRSKVCAPSDTVCEEEADRGRTVLSMSERYHDMRNTLHRRLTFGKSAIHGWGVFTKKTHSAGDMVIEYAGEIVRAIIADIRERRSYDSLVGAGTYMFRIDDEQVVDATHAGSVAHLINHSCEPNCYSRVVAASGKDRIIIFAKCDIAAGQELTYDYRFTSKDELLTCYCGCPGCRGSVNFLEADEEPSQFFAPRAELTQWFV